MPGRFGGRRLKLEKKRLREDQTASVAYLLSVLHRLGLDRDKREPTTYGIAQLAWLNPRHNIEGFLIRQTKPLKVRSRS